MAKNPTFPILYDELKTISISFLSKHGYLKPNQRQCGTSAWNSNGQKTDSISIKVDTRFGHSYIELEYSYNRISINYRVQLVSVLSNLDKGFVWYFICPFTGKRCRKLHLADTYFYHRSAFQVGMYKKQTQSKIQRHLDKTLGAYLQTNQLHSQLNKKHFKKQYAGKPTKKYLKLTRQIQKAENISVHEIENWLLR